MEVTDANFEKEVLKSDLPVLVDFWAPWCVACSMVAPAIEEVAENYDGKLKVCKLRVDEALNITSQYGITGIPTLIVFKEGQSVDQIVGAVSKSVLEERINQHL